MSTTAEAINPEAVVPSQSPGTFAARLLRRPAAVVAIAFLAALVLACVIAPWIAPYGPQELDLTRVLTGPSAHNWLGTDELGRDVLSRLLYGGRRSLVAVLEGVVAVLILGVPLGLITGYIGGWTDRQLSRFAEVIMAIPAIVLILVVLAVAPQNENAAMIVFGILGAPQMMRVVRAASLRVREELYVSAARVSGLSHPRIVIRHILPRVTGPIIVQASLFAAYALLFETGLGYLGLTSGSGRPSWGGMVGEASQVILQQKWLLFPPGVLIALTILAFGVLGDQARDAAAMDAPAARRTRRLDGSVSPADDDVERSGASLELVRDALLHVRGLSVNLGGPQDAPVVSRVSFSIAANETVGLVGESGCGKTVTALAVLRLLRPPLEISEGGVYWMGKDLRALSDREFTRMRGSEIAYVSQEPQASLDPTFTIGSQLSEVVRRHDGGSRRAAKRRALELLRLVELPDPERVAQTHAYELSGGMAQRVAIAIALAGRPKLLIADEPTTALDVTVQAGIMQLLRRLQQETGMGIVLITHNWGLVADICDRTLVMYAGQIVEEADAAAIFERPLHPYTLGLLNSHPSLVEAGAEIKAMGGGVPPPGAWPEGCRFAARCPFAIGACLARPVPLLEVGSARRSRCIRVGEVFVEASA